MNLYFYPEHAAIWTNRNLAILTIICHLYFMFWAFLFHFIVFVHSLKKMFDIADKSLAFSEITKRSHLSTMWTFRSFFLNPLPQTFLTGNLTAGRAHFRLFQRLKANITVEKGYLGAGVHNDEKIVIIIISLMCNNTESYV